MKRLVRNFHDRHSDRIISIAARRDAECCAVTALLKLKQIRGILAEERGDEIKKLFEMRLRCLNDNPPVTVTCGRLSLDREACRNQARIILDSTSQVLRECSVRYGKITDVYAAYLRKSLFNEDGTRNSTAVGEIMKLPAFMMQNSWIWPGSMAAEFLKHEISAYCGHVASL